MMYTMKKPVFGVYVCLLLCCASALLNTGPEEDEENSNIRDAELPPLILVHPFCAFKAETGPCKALLSRFFFNIRTQKCEEFIYGGCEGNQNRFISLEECKKQCTLEKTTEKNPSQKGKPAFCFLEEDPGICRGYLTRYFYNSQSKKCERFKYGGCLGNRNNFESLKDCRNTCEDTLPVFQVNDSRAKTDAVNNSSLLASLARAPGLLGYRGPSWCLTPADRGLCQANILRYYYNGTARKCSSFQYSGCGGNENNFTSKKACLQACDKGFFERISKEGLIKTKRKRKKQTVTILYEKN
ncbi:tissue factor pathway inhibitor isoform X2 [Erinaceus europaeus]|uniref:Tissue factor pathway inhibitor n=1 Tax=Erinaceus europaeus TaxID=9365 RepID=A0A1S3WJS0_ERIEU|nr:tissue factor pathway inhibitor isoform X2 [Erinaceus europaeus]